MTVTELLEKIRDYYLNRFKQEIDHQRNNGFETIIEPELLDKSGRAVHEGIFETPCRSDLVVLKGDTPIESIMIDTESKLTFSPITLQWSQSLMVTIEPFQWNYLTLGFIDISNVDWTHLKTWFNHSFREKHSSGEFRSVVHFMSDPYKVDDKLMVDIDLGSGTLNDFENLLDSLDKMKLTAVTIK